MKSISMLFLAVAVVFASCSSTPGVGNPKLTNEIDTVSYALGVVVATSYISQLQQQQLSMFDTVDYALLSKAFAKSTIKKEYLDFITPKLDSISVEQFMNGYLSKLATNKEGAFDDLIADGILRAKSEKVGAKAAGQSSAIAQKNLEIGQSFLAENKSKPGIFETSTGLQYQIITEGKGAKPLATDNVNCIYHGTLIDGTVFDSSKDRGETATFNVSEVIAGWQEALPMMPVGSKWKLFIPAHLAYGEADQGTISPNSTLIFEIELVSIAK